MYDLEMCTGAWIWSSVHGENMAFLQRDLNLDKLQSTVSIKYEKEVSQRSNKKTLTVPKSPRSLNKTVEDDCSSIEALTWAVYVRRVIICSTKPIQDGNPRRLSVWPTYDISVVPQHTRYQVMSSKEYLRCKLLFV